MTTGEKPDDAGVIDSEKPLQANPLPRDLRKIDSSSGNAHWANFVQETLKGVGTPHPFFSRYK